jgi:hypothetical protein
VFTLDTINFLSLPYSDTYSNFKRMVRETIYRFLIVCLIQFDIQVYRRRKNLKPFKRKICWLLLSRREITIVLAIKAISNNRFLTYNLLVFINT